MKTYESYLTTTEERLIQEMKAWMVQEHGEPRQLTKRARDAWYRDHGMLVSFIRAMFEKGEAAAARATETGE